MQKTHIPGNLIRRCSAASGADNVLFPYMDGEDDEEALNTASIEKFLTWDDLHNAMLINRTRNSREEFLQSPSAGLFRCSSAASSAGHLFFPRKSGGNDEEALCWAAIERLPSFERMRRAMLTQHVDGIGTCCEEIDVTRLDIAARRQLMEKILHIIEEDNERLLLKLRHRIDKVNIKLPSIEVRFEHLSVNANVHVGSRALTTLYNFTVNALWDFLSRLRLVPSKKRNITILNDATGIIRPSRMTLLLGPPRSGRTTFLLALAGNIDSAVKVSGRITYNGHEFMEFVPQRNSAYISQNDVHIGQMTVRETMDFSGRCQGVGTRYEMLMELLRREKLAGIKPDADVDVFIKAFAVEGAETSLVTDYILKILGLDVCADTMIGDEMRQGVSGGQKKRVTMAEMLVGPAQALFMDEISTGLDSSTTFQIVKCLRQSVRHIDGTMVIALLQPPPETFELFDDIILLSEGQIVYQGPRESILNFFEHLGFKCPERKSIADFLQEVTSRKDQQQYWAVHNQPYIYVPIDEFVKGFKSYHVGQRLLEDLAVPYDKSRSHPTALATEKYGLNQWGFLQACLAREMLLMRRNTFVYMFGTVQVLLLVIIDMTVFLQTKSHQDNIDDANPYMGSIFFFLMCALFNGYPELSLTVERLPVYYKQRSMLMYPTWAYTIPAWLATIPISFLQMGVCVVLSYYVVGFAPQAERFLKQFLVLFLVHQVALGLFRFVASIGSDMVASMPIANFALVVVFLCGGFIISKENIPVWWNWGFWASPLTYGQNALVINEFLAPRWEKPNPDQTIGEETLGRAILKSRGFFTESYWYWIGIGALCGYIVFFNVLFTICLAYLGPVGKGQRAIPQDKLDEEHASQNGSSLDGSKMEADIEFQACHSMQNQHHAQGGVILENGMILPFQPLALAFDNISYYVDMPLAMRQHGAGKEKLQLLRNVSGSFRPGVLTSLVGVSGAGKTTLMDVLAGRKTGGYIEGSISVSGYPKKQETFTRISGYCEQTDRHSPNLTVYESLIYSAWLRLHGNVDQKTRRKFVYEIMELVELSSIKDALIGLPGVMGLSIEQRKRLTIAVELVANPSIIFMDELTSGLDARAAAVVMRSHCFWP